MCKNTIFQNFFFENFNETIVILLVIVYFIMYFRVWRQDSPFKSLNWSSMILAYFGGIVFDAECNVSGHWQ